MSLETGKKKALVAKLQWGAGSVHLEAAHAGSIWVCSMLLLCTNVSCALLAGCSLSPCHNRVVMGRTKSFSPHTVLSVLNVEHLTLYTHPSWTPGRLWWSFLPLSLWSWFCCSTQWSAEYQAAFPSQNLLLNPSDWHFPRPHQQISFISSASADHKNYQDLFHFTDTSGISPDLYQTKWNGNWGWALDGGVHTHCHLPPLPTGAGGWIASAHILMARAPPLRKKYSYKPKSWLSLSLMHLQPIAFDRKPFPGSI